MNIKQISRVENLLNYVISSFSKKEIGILEALVILN